MQTATVLVRCNGEVELRDYEAASSFVALLSPIPQISTVVLPTGPWPKQKSTEENSQRTAINKFFEDYSRLTFLRSLGTPVMKINDVRTFGLGSNTKHKRKKHHYEGVVLRTGTGKLVALLDCPLQKNALYAFDAEVPDWTEAINLKRYAIHAFRPKAFIRKFRHSGNWQERVANFLRG